MKTDQPRRESATVHLRTAREEIGPVADRVMAALARHQFPESSRFAVRLALEEALSNAMRHGHRALPDATVRLDYTVDGSEIVMIVEDQGPGFKPESVPDPTLDENLELPTGRGLLLMRSYMAKVEYNDAGNRVTMVYRLPKGGRNTTSDPATAAKA